METSETLYFPDYSGRLPLWDVRLKNDSPATRIGSKKSFTAANQHTLLSNPGIYLDEIDIKVFSGIGKFNNSVRKNTLTNYLSNRT